MKISFPKIFFVSATDTCVGKTFISTILTKGLKATYYKPIQAGMPADTDFVKKYSSLSAVHFLKETHILKMATYPHLAAKKEKISIKLSNFKLPRKITTSHLIIEGCGGLMVPINENYFIIDLIKKFSVPTLLIARSTLGTINHTLLSLAQLRDYQIPVLGVILNGPKNEGNKIAIEKFGKVSVLAEIEIQKNISPDIIQELFEKNFL